MNTKKYFLPVLLIYLLSTLGLHAQMFGQTPDERKSDYDVENIKIEVTLNLERKQLTAGLLHLSVHWQIS